MSRPAFVPQSRPAVEACSAHHWIVAATPHAGRYPARCRRCRARRDFPLLDDQFNHETDQLLPRQADLVLPDWTPPQPLIAVGIADNVADRIEQDVA